MGLASNFLLLARNPFSVPLMDQQTGEPTFLTDATWNRMIHAFYLDPALVTGFSEKLTELNNAYPGIGRFYKEQDIAMYNYMSHFPVSQDPDALASFNWDMVATPTFKEKPEVGTQQIIAKS